MTITVHLNVINTRKNCFSQRMEGLTKLPATIELFVFQKHLNAKNDKPRYLLHFLITLVKLSSELLIMVSITLLLCLVIKTI